MAVIDLSTYDGEDRVISVTEMQRELIENRKNNVFSVASLIPGLDK